MKATSNLIYIQIWAADQTGAGSQSPHPSHSICRCRPIVVSWRCK